MIESSDTLTDGDLEENVLVWNNKGKRISVKVDGFTTIVVVCNFITEIRKYPGGASLYGQSSQTPPFPKMKLCTQIEAQIATTGICLPQLVASLPRL